MKLSFFSKSLSLFALVVLMSNTEAMTPGNSAWLYDKSDVWVSEISHFNQSVPPKHRLNYLFPETAIIHIDSEKNTLLMTYDASVTKFYKSRLPHCQILPDLSFWVANTSFKTWSPLEYERAAKRIVDLINQDPNADGVFLDLETYQPSFLPFYRTLVAGLNKTHKVLSVIVRPGQENKTWFDVLGKNAFIVLYGYDLHHPEDTELPVSPETYQARLQAATNHLVSVAETTQTPFMGGLPLIATTYEWEEKIYQHPDNKRHLKNTYPQIAYAKAALETYQHISSKLALGYSIWAFVSHQKSQTQIYLPDTINDESWALLKDIEK